jgi:hypothetical protein
VILDSIARDLEIADPGEEGLISATFRVARGDGD